MQNQTPYSGGFHYTPMNWYMPPIPETPEQREEKQLRRDGNCVGLIALAVTAGTQLTFTVVALALCLFGVWNFQQLSEPTLGLSNTAFLLFYAGIYTFAMGAPAVLTALACGYRIFPLGPSKPVSTGNAFFGTLAGMGLCMLANLLASYIVSIFAQFGVEPPQMPDYLEATPTSFLLNILVIAVLPALLEEMVFRGYILRTLRPYGDGLAVAVSALLFGLMHGNIMQVPFAFVVGLALGWLYVTSDNIWLPIFVHFLNNALSISMDYLGRFLPEDKVNLFMFVIIGVIGVLGGIALLLLTFTRSKLMQKTACTSLLSVSKRLKSLLKAPALVISVIVFVLLMVVSIL